MKMVFADTSYWTALLDWKDDLHPKALAIAKTLGPVRIITSELVLMEMLNTCLKDLHQKRMAVAFTAAMREDLNITIIGMTPELFQAAFKRYSRFEDKQWSMTDCASFELMKKHKITRALTYDKHFEQAGFVALLREGN